MALSPPAGQGGTGDPRLPCRTRPSLRRHPLAGGGMSPHAAPSRFALSPSPSTKTALLVDERATLPSPSTKTALLVDEWPFRLRHPRKRPFWWTNGPFASGGPGRHRRPPPALPHTAFTSQAPPSRGWHVASCRPVPLRPFALAIHQNGTFGGRTGHFALAIHQNGTFGGRMALSPPPSTKTAFLVDEWPFRLRRARAVPAVQGGTGDPGSYR